jgi:pimeloyl-ACP methyl ester carboxylesterase
VLGNSLGGQQAFLLATDHGHAPWLEPGEKVETRVQSFLYAWLYSP